MRSPRSNSSASTLEAFINFHYDSGEKQLLTVPFPGTGFRIPGIATIGPALALKGRLEASASVSATMEARLDVASWEFDYRLPMDPEMEPETNDKPDYDNTGNKNGIPPPEFYAGVLVHGEAKAHLLASVQFGIDFDDRWKVGAATAALVADAWIQPVMEAGISTEATCPFTWGLNAGVDLYLEARVPDMFKWEHSRFKLPGSRVFPVFKGGQCPDLKDGAPDPLRRRSLDSGDHGAPLLEEGHHPLRASQGKGNQNLGLLQKRSSVIGPFIQIPLQEMFCPLPESGNGGDVGTTKCEEIVGWESSDMEAALRRRSPSDGTTVFEDYEPHELLPDGGLARRSTDTSRTSKFCTAPKLSMRAPPYETSGTLNNRVPGVSTFGYLNPTDCNDFGFDTIPLPNAEALTAGYVRFPRSQSPKPTPLTVLCRRLNIYLSCKPSPISLPDWIAKALR
ncbi:hypothetical protein IMZ48_25470 [Candidatus Bathyarchaeota archaeon]|nr:hypothetical protein [Candidatus Bathyarchaeota archaeon]